MINTAIGFVGVGNMGSAILRGLLDGGTLVAENAVIFDVDAEKCSRVAQETGARAARDVADLVGSVDTVLLAVKPQSMGECLDEMGRHLAGPTLVISIAAGISTGYISNRLGESVRVVRVMPNTPAMVGAGIAGGSSGAGATEDDMALATEIFGTLGEAVTVSEELIDAVTAVSGSGPAYFFYLAEKLAEAGVKNGLPEDVAVKLARKTMEGAGALLSGSADSPAQLRRKVTSKGGTTEAALGVLDKLGFGKLVEEAVTAAAERSRELAK